jgi:hypothetical protein
VRLEAARYALAEMTKREPVEAWIVDDTGFLKQGSHSVGVQRQYTGTAGNICNCQTAPSLSIATRTEQLPIDFELYLPKLWTEDAARRAEDRIPWNTTFATKPEQLWCIAGLGGHIKNNGPAGWQVLQRGMEKFVTFAAGWCACACAAKGLDL